MEHFTEGKEMLNFVEKRNKVADPVEESPWLALCNREYRGTLYQETGSSGICTCTKLSSAFLIQHHILVSPLPFTKVKNCQFCTGELYIRMSSHFRDRWLTSHLKMNIYFTRNIQKALTREAFGWVWLFWNNRFNNYFSLQQNQ